MKKKLIFILIILVSVIFLTYQAYNYYTPPSFYKLYKIDSHKNDTVYIAYIGDSWAFLHQEHDCHIPTMFKEKTSLPVVIKSFGVPGQTSKEIYESLFNKNKMNLFLQQNHFDYCIVAIGINDTDNKMSEEYYKKSMDGIIQILLANEIWPIIIEIPNYDIKKAFANQGKLKTCLRKISMFINNVPLDCKQTFRNALREVIQEKGYEEKAFVIKYKSWNTDYTKDLRRLYQNDGLHLNDKGYAVLDSAITKEIVRIHKKPH